MSGDSKRIVLANSSKKTNSENSSECFIFSKNSVLPDAGAPVSTILFNCFTLQIRLGMIESQSVQQTRVVIECNYAILFSIEN